MHKGKHRRTPPRHRRTTVGDHFRKLTAIGALFAAMVGFLFAVPMPADADKATSSAHTATSTVDYGSGPAAMPVSAAIRSTPDYVSRSTWMILGDSISKQGYKALQAEKPDQRLAVDVQAGRNTKLSVDSVLAILAAVGPDKFPGRLVVATGSNDVMLPFAFEAQMKRLLEALPERVQVYWVDIYVNRPRYPSADLRNTDVINKRIWRYCVDRCSVISWSDFLAGYPGYRIPRHLSSDGVHLTVYGIDSWAKIIAGRVTM